MWSTMQMRPLRLLCICLEDMVSHFGKMCVDVSLWELQLNLTELVA